MRRADNFTTFMCRLSWNLGASNSWNPQGLSKPVMGLLHLLLVGVVYRIRMNVILKRHSKCILQLGTDNCRIVRTTHIRRKKLQWTQSKEKSHTDYTVTLWMNGILKATVLISLSARTPRILCAWLVARVYWIKCTHTKRQQMHVYFNPNLTL